MTKANDGTAQENEIANPTVNRLDYIQGGNGLYVNWHRLFSAFALYGFTDSPDGSEYRTRTIELIESGTLLIGGELVHRSFPMYKERLDDANFSKSLELLKSDAFQELCGHLPELRFLFIR